MTPDKRIPPLQRTIARWNKYDVLKPLSCVAPAKPEKASAPRTKRGPAPFTHGLTRATVANGRKTYQMVAGLWAHGDGKGFNLRLTAKLQPGDNLFIRPIPAGAP